MDSTECHGPGGRECQDASCLYLTENHTQKALYFPNISGSRLDTRAQTHTTDMCRGRVSVIAMLSTRMSEVPCGFLFSRDDHLTSTRYMSTGSWRQRMRGICRTRYTNISRSICKKTFSSRGWCLCSCRPSQRRYPRNCMRRI